MVYMNQLEPELLIYDVPLEEGRALNMLFSRLYNKKDVDKAYVFKLLSGLRAFDKGTAKTTKGTAKAWLRRWHRQGWITMLHGRVRLGNMGLFMQYLTKDNINLLIR
jgi:hypothetical protein